MSYSDHRVYVHFVWATKFRQRTLPMDLERSVHRILQSEARKLGCRVVALNGTEDHVHLLIQMGPQATLARLANQMKGVTALFINNETTPAPGSMFEWQSGYGAFSVGRNQIRVVIDYINRQKEHHSNENLWASLEPPPEAQTSPPQRQESTI